MKIIIAGDGKVGATLTRQFTAEDHDVTVIDSNASILGGDTFIGDGAVIGGSVFVCESVPANARVGMQEQKLNITVR